MLVVAVFLIFNGIIAFQNMNDTKRYSNILWIYFSCHYTAKRKILRRIFDLVLIFKYNLKTN